MIKYSKVLHHLNVFLKKKMVAFCLLVFFVERPVYLSALSVTFSKKNNILKIGQH